MRAVVIAARRSAVAPRGGAFASLQADELAAPVIKAVLQDAGISPEQVDHVIMGNALYGGGNPARLAALRAGLPQEVPSQTLDTQCCSGLDAIIMAARLIEAGAASCVIAGGAESFSRSPIRMHRPLVKGAVPEPYLRPAFAPFWEDDPDLTEAAAELAEQLGISREAQAAYAVASHAKALSLHTDRPELVRIPDSELDHDPFTRDLSERLALRAPVIAGKKNTGVSAATVAVEADAAAFVLVVSEELARKLSPSVIQHCRFEDGFSFGGSPRQPALVPVTALRRIMEKHDKSPADYECLELMEAYAIQAMATLRMLDWPHERVNLLGGALARGHPVGASGAILAVNLIHLLQKKRAGAQGIAGIAAAGGLASTVVFERA